MCLKYIMAEKPCQFTEKYVNHCLIYRIKEKIIYVSLRLSDYRSVGKAFVENAEFSLIILFPRLVFAAVVDDTCVFANP